jgi:cytochrome c oxidase assembly protein subunit 15
MQDARAWKEMGHRYLAGALGILIFILAFMAWRTRQSPWLATAIAALVIVQATLGKWTVTMLLKPAIVVAHLAGGMALLALLVWFSLGRFAYAPAPEARMLRGPAAAGLAFLSLQILLGGWVSANYAGLACPDLPLCLGQAMPPMDFGNAFHVLRELGRTDAGELLPQAALTAIHWGHRMFALVVLALVGWVALKTFRFSTPLAIAIALLLLAQFALGIANVAFSLPLALAAAHNAGAALLLGSLVVLNFFSFRGLRPSF